MGAQVGGRHHFTAQPCVDALSNIANPIGIFTSVFIKPGELIHIPARLEPEPLEQIKLSLLRQNGDGETSSLLHHVMGIVALVHCDDYAVWVGGHLNCGIRDTAVVLVPLAGGQHKQTIAQGIHDLVVHKQFLLVLTLTGMRAVYHSLARMSTLQPENFSG